jgi:hypothetical protein
MAKIRPKGFEPPYPAWSPALPETLGYVQAQIAIQSRSGRRDDHMFGALVSKLSEAGGLRHFERVGHLDTQGAYNDIAICYWKTPDAMRAWLSPDGPFGSFAGALGEGQCDAWYEAIIAPRAHYEINASTPDPNWGLSIEYGSRLEPDHAYWGAMRDRIAAAEDGGLSDTIGPIARMPKEERRQVRFKLPPNICLIRTVQGLSGAPEEEIKSYRADMRPQYERGVQYLVENPIESRCLSARLVNYELPGPGRPNTETIAWFASLADLERWVHDHPTHKAIYAASQAHATRFAPKMRLLLGHEVVVAPAGCADAMYVGCHPDTGLMPYFQEAR